MSVFTDFVVGGSNKWWDEIYTTTAVDIGNGVVQNPAEITTSTNITIPSGVIEVVVGTCGAGAGAWGSTIGSGGGGSAMSYHKIAVTPGEIIAVTIGAGAVFLASGANNGGDTSFGAYITALGGLGATSPNKGGIGRNGGTNGGGQANSYGTDTVAPLVVSKYKYGMLVLKTISPTPLTLGGSYGAPSGGVGGGIDYESYGHGASNYDTAVFSTNPTDGICVIWY